MYFMLHFGNKKGDDKFAFVCIRYLYPKYPVVGGKGYPLFLSRISDF